MRGHSSSQIQFLFFKNNGKSMEQLHDLFHFFKGVVSTRVNLPEPPEVVDSGPIAAHWQERYYAHEFLGFQSAFFIFLMQTLHPSSGNYSSLELTFPHISLQAIIISFQDVVWDEGCVESSHPTVVDKVTSKRSCWFFHTENMWRHGNPIDTQNPQVQEVVVVLWRPLEDGIRKYTPSVPVGAATF